MVAANGDAILVGIFLLRVYFAEKLGAGDLFAVAGWMSLYLITKKVLMTLTCLLCTSGLVPMPWNILPSLLDQESFHMAWNLG